MPRLVAVARPATALPPQGLLTQRALAEALGLSERTIVRLRAAGLPYVALPVPGRKSPIVRYEAGRVREWLAACEKGAPSVAQQDPPPPVRRGRPRRRPAGGDAA